MANWQGKAQKASTQPKELQAMKDDESRRNSLPQGRAHKLVIQYQMVNPEITSYTIQTEQLGLTYQEYVYVCKNN